MLNLSPFSIVKEQFSPSAGMPPEVQAVNMFSEVMKPILEVYERQWFLNIANYMGNQWIAFDRITRRFIVPPAPSWRVRLVINKILPIARIQMAKLHEVRPNFYVASRTNTDQDIESARISSKIVESMFNDSEFKNYTYDDIVNFMVLTGNAYVFPLYDPDMGKEIRDRQIVPVVNPLNNQIVIDPETQQPVMKEVERVFNTGDIRFDFTDPFELMPDFSTTKWSEQRAVIKRKLRSTEYVFEKYGVKVAPEALDLNYSSPMRAMAQATVTGIATDVRQTLRHAVVVKDYYEAPSKRHPQGRHIIVAGDKLLHSETLTTKLHGHHAIPFVPFQGIRVPKRLLAMSPIENVLPLQWQYNRGRSQIIEDVNLMTRPKLLAPMDSMADGTFTDQPGEIVFYDASAGQIPQYLNPPTVAPAALNNLERLDQEMQDIGGVHEISMGRLPRRATSGLALNILEEKDTTIIGPMKQSLRNGLEKVFSFALSIAADRFKEGRLAKILGTNGMAEEIKFTGADITSDDVRVVLEEQFPQSRAAKLEFAMQLVQNGILSGQSIRKMLNLDTFTSVDKEIGDEEARRIAAEQQALQAQRGQEGNKAGQSKSNQEDPEELARAVAEEMAARQDGLQQ